MAVKWRDDLIRLSGKINDQLGGLVPAKLFSAYGGINQTSQTRNYKSRSVRVRIAGWAGQLPERERVEPNSKFLVRVYDPAIVMKQGDYFTWGGSSDKHYVLQVRGLMREPDGSRYGAWAECT